MPDCRECFHRVDVYAPALQFDELPVPDALPLLQGQVSVEDMLKRRIMVELKKGV